MGYTTKFTGELQLDRFLTYQEQMYLDKFSDIRHMKRVFNENIFNQKDLLKKIYPNKTKRLIDNFGVEGEFYVGDDEISVIDHNTPPRTQPGLWCQWIVKGDKLMWDGNEKFYNYVEWLQYMIDNFFIPWGITLNGELFFSGERTNDCGKIIVVNNKITKKMLSEL